MALDLHPLIVGFVEASNSRDTDRLLALFSDDAVVRDEGNEYRGIDRIRAWRADVEAKYTFTTTPREVAERGDETVLIGSLAGDFPGSPVDLEHRFALAGDRIMALTIQP
jgi:ketosteroid isomerase-like protein